MTLTNKADVTIKNVNFDGKGYNGYAVESKGAYYVTIEDCTAKNYGYGFVQVAKGSVRITVKNVTVSNVNYGIKVDYSNAVVLENVDITAGTAAVLNSNYGEKTITIKNSKLNILGTWTRNNTTKTTYVFEGANTIDSFITDAAIDNFKLAVGATLTAPNEITVTATEAGYSVKYEDGKYSVEEVPEIIVNITGKSLLLKDIVQVKYFVGFDPAIKSSITASGLYIWDNEADANALNFANAIWHNTEARDEGTYQGNAEYSFRSDGIPAKEMADLQYVVGYIVVDGNTYYTSVEAYSPKTWCENKKNDPAEKNIAAALMNYGAAAQIYFGYKTDDLMNEGFDSYTFNTDMLTNIIRVKGAELNGFKENGYSLVLKGAIQYKIYYVAEGLSGKSGFGIEYQIGNGEIITVEGFELEGSEYFVKIEGVAAKDLDEVVTVRPFYTENGERVYGNESKFCAETWVNSKMTSTSTSASALKDKAIAPALGNYIVTANQRFANN